ncbi:deoxyribonuclease [Thermococcus sp. P6]|uniref:YchF/TatD family DNA exonuclease n=1 Tax=Thermococcus sp. P6 TaxID=122420 RepID=UPI000B5A1AAA|nr:TatD family hydrolase [Thermococcus sp. P6]ASJ11085.1 deoxyribonuclease [Thermococcus sp. P6]
MIDAHAHFELYRKDAPRVIEECRGKVKAVVDSITEYRKAHVHRSWELLRPYFGFVIPTLGYHPNEARRGNLEKVKRVEEFILEHRHEIVAIGEVGLDYHYARSEGEREKQRTIFRRFLELAVELGMPVVIHARDAEREAFELVQRAGVRAYFHSFTGSPELAREIAGNGHLIGISTGIAFIPGVREVVEALEVENITTETDSPYMSPVRGERNTPCNVRMVVDAVAKLKGLDFEEVAGITEKNAMEFFGVDLKG